MSLSTAKPRAPTDSAEVAQLRVSKSTRKARKTNSRRRSLSPSQEPPSPTTHKTELAARLKQLRAEHGLSQSQLARATGIFSSFLSLIEQAQSDITIGRLVRLAEFYDVELADLLNGPPSAPADHVRILRTAPDHMLHSRTEGVDVYDLTCGARWTLVPALSSFRPGGSIEIDDEHEHERMIYILDGTFELVFPGEPPNPSTHRRGRDLPQRRPISHHERRERTRPCARSPRASRTALETGGGEPPAHPRHQQITDTRAPGRQSAPRGEPAARPLLDHPSSPRRSCARRPS